MRLIFFPEKTLYHIVAGLKWLLSQLLDFHKCQRKETNDVKHYCMYKTHWDQYKIWFLKIESAPKKNIVLAF